jgi:hypothetical protein
MLTITNATKTQLVVTINAIFGVLAAFNVGHLSNAQQGSILIAANAVLGLIGGVTYKSSKKRVPDPPALTPS